jgi:hypothetical protein
MHRARLPIAVATALILATIVGGLRADRASAGAEACNPCVVIIEVDGLEGKDVTPETTPFLWALGHPAAGGGNTATDPGASPVAIGAAATPGISGRDGWTWAAARGVMTGTTAAATTALLTGSYPDQSDIYADEYWGKGVSEHTFMGSSQLTYMSDYADLSPFGDRLPSLVESPNEAGAWVGDARVADAVGLDGTWVPAKSDSVPAYCPVPQDQAEATAYPDYANQSPPSGGQDTFSCPTPDVNTVNHAESDLAGADGANVTLGYVFLAELGAVKRLHGDVDVTADTNAATGTQGQTQDARAVADQLRTTDAAIGAFVNKFQSDNGPKWGKTVLFVVGNHGYELTPQTQRVPDDKSSNPGMGLADVVSRVAKEHGAAAEFVPQGTIGTVYVHPGPKHDEAVTAIADYLRPGGPVDSQQRCQPVSAGTVPPGTVETGCIQEVLATGALGADGHSSAIPDDAGYKFLSVTDAHPSWHLHYVDDKGAPSGTDGDLLVVLKPGWAAGEFVPVKDENGVPNPLNEHGTVNNPYLGSPGGPRNRSIAAIVNGPQDIVKQIDVGAPPPGASPSALEYPVSTAPLNGERCPGQPTEIKAAPGNPNLSPGDDANAPGHECQAEVVDFAPTIAALLKISVKHTQLGGRFLREAFDHDLSPVREEEPLVDIPPDDPPPAPEPDVRVPDPPPPPKGYTYSGLMKRLRATVVDQYGCDWATAKPGATMDYLKIEVDLGKSLSSSTLTFYRRGAKPAAPAPAAKQAKHRAHVAAAPRAANTNRCLKPPATAASAHKAAARPPLNAIARFNPFALKRGHVVLKLKIPPLYRPTHIGMFLQEARRVVPSVKPDGSPGLSFEAFGPAAGKIVAIIDGGRLHETKAARSAAGVAAGHKPQSKKPTRN